MLLHDEAPAGFFGVPEHERCLMRKGGVVVRGGQHSTVERRMPALATMLLPNSVMTEQEPSNSMGTSACKAAEY